MYLAHFGLREFPFSLTPDTAFFFACSSYQEALNTLLVAARNGEGFIKITGEVGNGKTLLCRKFLATLPEDTVAGYIPNPYLDPRGLLAAVAEELRVPVDAAADPPRVLKALTEALLEYARQGKRVIVCLDEAQAMPLDSLEALRLLTNLETEKRKLLQVVLFGQPELEAKLAQQSVRQLRQRITFQYRLGGLRRDETELYVAHRLAVAGYQGGRMFSKGAMALLHRACGGTPRIVNVLAHKALLLAYGEGSPEVLARHVRAAASDTPAARRLVAPWLWWTATMLAVSVGGLGWTLLR